MVVLDVGVYMHLLRISFIRVMIRRPTKLTLTDTSCPCTKRLRSTWTAQAAPQETTERRPTAMFSAPEKPVEGRMVLRNSTSDALATQTQGLLAARPAARWRLIGDRARAEGHP